LLEQKRAQNVANSLGYFIFSKSHNEPPKVAPLAKNDQSGHPEILQEITIRLKRSKTIFELSYNIEGITETVYKYNAPGTTTFTTLHFHRNLRMSSIS